MLKAREEDLIKSVEAFVRALEAGHYLPTSPQWFYNFTDFVRRSGTWKVYHVDSDDKDESEDSRGHRQECPHVRINQDQRSCLMCIDTPDIRPPTGKTDSIESPG